MAPSGETQRSARAWSEWIALATMGGALAAFTWRRWPDLLVDFGQQLYIPWRLAQGERLHRDIFFLHGPLSQHAHALLFRLFGTSFGVLIAANLVVLAAALAAAHAIVRRATDRLTAFATSVIFLGLFAFAQYVWSGNYNWMSPYTHEATHGTALALGMILFLARYLAAGRSRDAAIGGLLLGLALLTKAEVALAAAGTAAAAWLLAGLLPAAGPADGTERAARPARPPRPAAAGLLFAACAIAPVAAAFAWFLFDLTRAAALRAVFAGFLTLSPEVAANPFYRRVLGLDGVAANLRSMVAMTALAAGVLAVVVGVDVGLGRRLRDARPVGAGMALALFGALVIWPGLMPWMELPRALPAAVLVLVGVLAARLRGRLDDPVTRARRAPLLLLAIFGLLLVAKTGLNTHLYHYGFFLALPATLAVAAAAMGALPRRLRAAGAPGTVARALCLALAAGAVVYHLRWSAALYPLKTLSVGRAGDAILTYGPGEETIGAVTAEALAWIERATPPGSTLVGLPEGIMLNYLARRPTTVPCVNFMMTETILFGEEAMVRALEARPPDFIALVHKDTAEFGVGPFGADPRYGRRIMEWIAPRYEPVARFGDEPFAGGGFGIRILARRGVAPSGARANPVGGEGA